MGAPAVAILMGADVGCACGFRSEGRAASRAQWSEVMHESSITPIRRALPDRTLRSGGLVTAAALAFAFATLCACATPTHQTRTAATVRVDFTDAETVSRWQPTHDVRGLEATPSGMRILISGGDPYVIGPPLDPPQGTALWLRVRLWSDVAGTLQAFHFTTGPTEQNSARASVGAKRWVEVSMPLPPLPRGTRLRLDPPGVSGACTIAWIELTERRLFPKPAWSPPPPLPKAKVLKVRSGQVLLTHDPKTPTRFALSVAGYPMASGWSSVPVAYEAAGEPRWFDLAKTGRTTIKQSGSVLKVLTTATDPDGARWQLQQDYRPAKREGGIDLNVTFTVSKPRTVFFLPMVAMFPGHGSFGAARERGLFAGLEYLDPPDKSSSEDDLRGEQAQRLVPDQSKVTFPLMVMQARKRYVGLIWTQRPWFAAAFDSPDRSFGSRANAMAVLFPGSDGTNRHEGRLLPYSGRLLEAGYKLTASATIIGGVGDSVLPAVQRYVADRALPPAPATGMNLTAYARWAAGGWLDSRIREGARFRHAYWPGWTSFAPTVAADTAMWMEWLAEVCADDALAGRLRTLRDDVLEITDPATRNSASVSHVTYPAPALLFGDVATSVEHARQAARAALQRFESDGIVLYRAGKVDYGTTHFEKHANGLTAAVLSGLLTNALYAGDAELMAAGIRHLRAMDRYVNTAPRGAQTWEVPLHTPDILASAYLVKAYLIGYEYTGEAHFLNMARHWAWTGVPFVYLVHPTPEPIGLYATIPVYGATGWVAPNWMGLPVQWCGLVYSDALYRLARYDPSGPWRRLAHGIAASGVQQSWPASDKDLQALLPDSVTLRSQSRNAVAINPGTVQANAIRLYGGPEVYDHRVFRTARITVLAPGAITSTAPAAGKVQFKVRGWTSRPYHVLIHGLRARPRVTVNGQQPDKVDYDAETGRLVLTVSGSPTISIDQ